MRVDVKPEGPRQSMSWLHTWASLILGWLLYAIFLTGTLSFFQNEITVWMKPEFHQSVPPKTQIEQTRVALAYLQQHHPDAGSWARWMVGVATLLMLVAIISGVITHKKIFKDFFTFRPGKGQRSWLDAHNATAVFALPFHIMITFSGLLLLLFTLMPWGVNQIYENRGAFLQDQRKSLVQDNSIQAESRESHSESKERRPQAERENHGERGEMSARSEGRRSRDEMQATPPAPSTDLNPILATAKKEWKNNPVDTITIIQPNTVKAEIELRALNGVSVAYRNVYPSLAFNGVTGDLEPDQTTLKTPSVANGIYNMFTTLHEARGVDLALRWLLFMSGVVGTLMIATGLILWCVKRAPQQQKQGYKSFGYRVVEVTNIAAIIGLPVACAAYFYANRFIPADMDMRLNWEIRSFFIVWLLTLLYAMIRSHRQAWLELLMLATGTFALLPIVNFLTGGQAIWNTIMHGQWVIASFDLAMWVLAILFWFSFKKVKNHKGLSPKKAKVALKENQS